MMIKELDLQIKKLQEEKNLLDKRLQEIEVENRRLELSNEMKKANIDDLKDIFSKIEKRS